MLSESAVSLFGEYGCPEGGSPAQGEHQTVNVWFQKDEMPTGKISSLLLPLLVAVKYHLLGVLHQRWHTVSGPYAIAQCSCCWKSLQRIVRVGRAGSMAHSCWGTGLSTRTGRAALPAGSPKSLTRKTSSQRRYELLSACIKMAMNCECL